MLTCGIVGLPKVGKTTIFNLLTNSKTEVSAYAGKSQHHLATARVPDLRIDRLRDLFKPKKTTYAQLELTDLPGLARGASAGQGVGNKFLEQVRQVDALIQVLRAFSSDDVPHMETSINPRRDLDILGSELLLADLQLVEVRLERLRNQKKKQPTDAETLAVLERIQAALEEETPVSSLGLTEKERESLQGLDFLTEKPMLLVVNLDEEQWTQGEYPGKTEIQEWAAQHQVPMVEISGQIEMELGDLDAQERADFMADLGIEEPGIHRVARATYGLLGLISFFTVGEDEVRAWTIRRGLTAKEAAGKIHSDISRGFIRAECVSYEDLITLGSLGRARDQGKVRLEGKDYIVADGDCINFRFNV